MKVGGDFPPSDGAGDNGAEWQDMGETPILETGPSGDDGGVEANQGSDSEQLEGWSEELEAAVQEIFDGKQSKSFYTGEIKGLDEGDYSIDYVRDYIRRLDDDEKKKVVRRSKVINSLCLVSLDTLFKVWRDFTGISEGEFHYGKFFKDSSTDDLEIVLKMVKSLEFGESPEKAVTSGDNSEQLEGWSEELEAAVQELFRGKESYYFLNGEIKGFDGGELSIDSARDYIRRLDDDEKKKVVRRSKVVNRLYRESSQIDLHKAYRDFTGKSDGQFYFFKLVKDLSTDDLETMLEMALGLESGGSPEEVATSGEMSSDSGEVKTRKDELIEQACKMAEERGGSFDEETLKDFSEKKLELIIEALPLVDRITAFFPISLRKAEIIKKAGLWERVENFEKLFATEITEEELNNLKALAEGLEKIDFSGVDNAPNIEASGEDNNTREQLINKISALYKIEDSVLEKVDNERLAVFLVFLEQFAKLKKRYESLPDEVKDFYSSKDRFLNYNQDYYYLDVFKDYLGDGADLVDAFNFDNFLVMKAEADLEKLLKDYESSKAGEAASDEPRYEDLDYEELAKRVGSSEWLRADYDNKTVADYIRDFKYKKADLERALRTADCTEEISGLLGLTSLDDTAITTEVWNKIIESGLERGYRDFLQFRGSLRLTEHGLGSLKSFARGLHDAGFPVASGASESSSESDKNNPEELAERNRLLAELEKYSVPGEAFEGIPDSYLRSLLSFRKFISVYRDFSDEERRGFLSKHPDFKDAINRHGSDWRAIVEEYGLAEIDELTAELEAMKNGESGAEDQEAKEKASLIEALTPITKSEIVFIAGQLGLDGENAIIEDINKALEALDIAKLSELKSNLEEFRKKPEDSTGGEAGAESREAKEKAQLIREFLESGKPQATFVANKLGFSVESTPIAEINDALEKMEIGKLRELKAELEAYMKKAEGNGEADTSPERLEKLRKMTFGEWFHAVYGGAKSEKWPEDSFFAAPIEKQREAMARYMDMFDADARLEADRKYMVEELRRSDMMQKTIEEYNKDPDNKIKLSVSLTPAELEERFAKLSPDKLNKLYAAVFYGAKKGAGAFSGPKSGAGAQPNPGSSADGGSGSGVETGGGSNGEPTTEPGSEKKPTVDELVAEYAPGNMPKTNDELLTRMKDVPDIKLNISRAGGEEAFASKTMKHIQVWSRLPEVARRGVLERGTDSLNGDQNALDSVVYLQAVGFLPRTLYGN